MNDAHPHFDRLHSLDSYYANFAQSGINSVESLATLSMQVSNVSIKIDGKRALNQLTCYLMLLLFRLE